MIDSTGLADSGSPKPSLVSARENLQMRRRLSSPAVVTAAVSAVLALAIWLADRGVEQRTIAQHQTEVAMRLGLYANGMSMTLRSRLERVSAVTAFIESASSLEDIDRGFPTFAAKVMHDGEGIRSIELQRAGVIDWVYPLAGNEMVLHANVRALFGDAVMDQIDSARAADRLVVTEPLPTLQGGLGVVARRAVHSRVRGAPDLVSLVVHLDSFMNVASLRSEAENLDIVILDRSGSVVSPAGAAPPSASLRADIAVPDGDWAILGAPRGGWDAAVAASLAPLRVAEVVIFLLLSLVVYAIVAGRRRLHAAVLARTGELEMANAELQLEVRERAKAEQALREQEEQLLHSQKMEAMGTLAGGIAHDFNNILTAILGFGRLASERAREIEGPSSADAVTEICADIAEVLHAAEHASVVTNQLLAFSRKQVINPVPFDVGEVVSEVEVLLRRLIGARVHLRVRVEKSPANVFADRGQMVQVLMNLAVNARDAMPDGGDLEIEVRGCTIAPASSDAALVPPGRYVELIVSDNGVGMAPEVIARAFEPFFTTKGVGKGTGLGLSTVFGIVRRAGGFVLAHSEVGHGTRFRILLPEHLVLTRPALRPIASAPRPGAMGTLLVAEDQPAVRAMVTRVLRRHGYTVLEARSGEEALALNSSTPAPIDMLVTDIVMPGIDGRALAVEVRRARPRIKVLFMSGYSDEAASLRTIDDVHNSFLAKPFTPEQFLLLVRRLLDAPAERAD